MRIEIAKIHSIIQQWKANACTSGVSFAVVMMLVFGDTAMRQQG